MATGVTYSDLENEIVKKHADRERRIKTMQEVANAMCHEVIKLLNIPSGRCRIGTIDSCGSFVRHDWAIGDDESLVFAIQVDYLSGEDVIAQHYASFRAKVDGGNVNLTCLESKGGALVNYAPGINLEHLTNAAMLAVFALKIQADKYRG